MNEPGDYGDGAAVPRRRTQARTKPGGAAVERGRPVERVLGAQAVYKRDRPVTIGQQPVYAVLTDRPQSVAALVEATGLTRAQVHTRLLGLKNNGHADRCGDADTQITWRRCD